MNTFKVAQLTQNAEKFDANYLKTRGLGSGFRFGLALILFS